MHLHVCTKNSVSVPFCACHLNFLVIFFYKKNSLITTDKSEKDRKCNTANKTKKKKLFYDSRYVAHNYMLCNWTQEIQSFHSQFSYYRNKNWFSFLHSFSFLRFYFFFFLIFCFVVYFFLFIYLQYYLFLIWCVPVVSIRIVFFLYFLFTFV